MQIPPAEYVNIIEERRGFGFVALILAFAFGMLAAQTYAHFALQCYRVVTVEEEREPAVETFVNASARTLKPVLRPHSTLQSRGVTL